MKNWKDKVLGIFAGIGIMSLLMSFQEKEDIYNKAYDPVTNKWVEVQTNSNPNVNLSSYQSTQNGRYQGTAVIKDRGSFPQSIIWIVDTHTGTVVRRISSNGAGNISTVRDF